MADEFVYCYYVGSGMAATRDGTWDENLKYKVLLGKIVFVLYSYYVDTQLFYERGKDIHLFPVLML